MPFRNRTLCNYYLYASCHLKSYQWFDLITYLVCIVSNFFDWKIRQFENSRANSNRAFNRGLAIRLFDASRDVITFHGPVLSFGHTHSIVDPKLIFWIRFTKPLYWWEKGGRDCGRLWRFGDSDTKYQVRISNQQPHTQKSCVWLKRKSYSLYELNYPGELVTVDERGAWKRNVSQDSYCPWKFPWVSIVGKKWQFQTPLSK